ncbi:MAG: ribonuclease [Chloroflexota bacterium]|nr:ribonuclease [Chloroflexota bacterium]
MPRTKITDLPEKPHIEYEKQLWEEGFPAVAGLDEAGRGAWAGPVYAAAVVLPNDERICDLLSGVRDSKRMTAKQRQRWQDCIKSASIAWAVGSASHTEIDELGIVPATCLAMRRAIEEINNPPNYLLVDYISIQDCASPQLSIPKGDCQSLSIAAASVLAKVARDTVMLTLDEEYPGYGLAQHKGYGTRAHRAALQQKGLLPIHRRSFHPMSDMD